MMPWSKKLKTIATLDTAENFTIKEENKNHYYFYAADIDTINNKLWLLIMISQKKTLSFLFLTMIWSRKKHLKQ